MKMSGLTVHHVTTQAVSIALLPTFRMELRDAFYARVSGQTVVAVIMQVASTVPLPMFSVIIPLASFVQINGRTVTDATLLLVLYVLETTP